MKKRTNITYLILPLLAFEWDENSKFQITFGWLNKTYTFIFN